MLKRAWACGHPDRIHYAKGKCTRCYMLGYAKTTGGQAARQRAALRYNHSKRAKRRLAHQAAQMLTPDCIRNYLPEPRDA